MNKKKVSEMLITLWMSVDQARYDFMVREAFENCPIKKQKEFIADLLNDSRIECDKETLEEAKKLIEETK